MNTVPVLGMNTTLDLHITKLDSEMNFSSE